VRSKQFAHRIRCGGDVKLVKEIGHRASLPLGGTANTRPSSCAGILSTINMGPYDSL
jgi:hypothetical protein